MTTTDWIIDLLLIVVVLRQLREATFSWHLLLLPLLGVGYAAHTYLHSVPTAGNDLVLLGLFVAVGSALGIAGGLTTRVRARVDGSVTVKASLTSAALWVVGTGGRLAFSIWVTHGGAGNLAHFSAGHDITSAAAWSAALIIMVVSEVALRMGIIALRVARARRTPVAPPQADLHLVAA